MLVFYQQRLVKIIGCFRREKRDKESGWGTFPISVRHLINRQSCFEFFKGVPML